MSYFNLHTHTEYSNFRLLDSTNKLNKVIDVAYELGLKGIAITDHETISGHVKAIQKHKKMMKENKDFKVILGNEIYLVDSLEEVRDNYKSGETVFYHFSLLAKDESGAEQIRRISSSAWENSFYTGKMERTPTIKSTLQKIIGKNKGHIIASTACFRKGTEIETRDGWKKIENIQSGDYVVNQYGEWEQVNCPTTRYYRGIGYQISLSGHDKPLVCTANHQFLTITRNRKEPKWVAAEDLRTDRGNSKDILLLPCNPYKYSQTNIIKKEEYVNCLFDSGIYGHKIYKLPDELEITPEIMRLFGLFLGDGSISLGKNCCVTFSFNAQEFDVFYDSFVKVAGEQLNIKWSISKRCDLNRVDISSGAVELIELFYYLFGNSKADTKHVPQRLRISAELDYELVFGYLLADGHFRSSPPQKTVNVPTGEFYSISISRQLSRDFYSILNTMGITTNIGYKKAYIGINGENHKEGWYLEGSNRILGEINKKQFYSHADIINIFQKAIKVKEYSDYVLIDKIKYRKIRIKNKKEIQMHEQVFCLNNNTHSFKCENVIVHNCAGGELGHWILKNDPESCLDFIDWCQDVFGEENFYLEMQPNDSEEQVKINQTIIKISEQLNIPYIITTDAHYLSADQILVHEAYLNSREDGSRETAEFYRTCYLMDEQEIHQWMDEQIGKENVDKALANTVKIGESIEFFDLECPTIVPAYDVPEFRLRHLFKDWYEECGYIEKFAYSENEYDRYFLKLVEDGFSEKVPYRTLDEEAITELLERIDVELKEMWLITEKLGTSISSYYLTTLDLVDTMWEEGDSFVGVARGSVTGMYTMYLIGITQLNPLPYNLKHWRHVSATKVELSDVDLDSAANARPRIIKAVKGKRGYAKVLNCCTFKTEGPKSAVLTAARGLGVSVEEAQYLAGLIPVTRGATWSIDECLYGNPEENKKPVTEFKNECERHENLLEIAQTIEGLVCGRSIHASAVYLFNEDYNKHNAMMKAPNGVYITQFNMADSDYCSGLKMDLLTVKALDKLRLCMDLLVEYGHMEWQGNLRKTYNHYLHPDVLDYDTPEMWDMVGRGEITDIFQFDTTVGKNAIKKIKPRTLVELASASSIMRLMITGDGGNVEQPMDTYVRYKNDINEWYSCMRNDYHLTEHEISILEKYLLEFNGVGATQEDVMLLSMDPEISNFDVKTSNLLRKGISKKNKVLQHEMKEMFFKSGREIGTSDNLLNYVWNEVVGKQLGYSFSINHTTPYACIALQEMNLAYHYPIVYWNTACLTINGGADDSLEENKSTNYGKIAVAIANMQENNIEISPPLINEAKFDFKPD